MILDLFRHMNLVKSEVLQQIGLTVVFCASLMSFFLPLFDPLLLYSEFVYRTAHMTLRQS